MAINFPNSPQLDDVYSESNRSWRWNGRFWQATSVTVGYTGSQGDQGESFRILGSVATVNDLPADSSGLPGDGYIIIDTGDLYIWDGSNWNNNGKIVGYTGSRGATGASVKLLGSVATEQDLPTDGTSDGSTLLVVGDAYIVQSSGNLFVWNGSEFTDVGKITGETGPLGYTGSQGDQGPIGYTGSSGSGGVDEFRAASVESGLSTVEYAVTVAGPQGSDSGNKYMLSGAYKPTANFVVGYIYVFNQDDATNVYWPNANGTTANPHPLNFSADNLSGELGGGTSYLTNVQYFLDDVAVTQTVYNSSSFETATARRVHITVTSTTPATLYYWCYNHTAMGNNILVAAPGSGITRYVNFNISGEISSPRTGVSRFYPPASITINRIYASISTQATGGDFTFLLNKNGVDIGTVFTISQDNFVMSPVDVAISMSTTDYLTVNITGVDSRDFQMKMRYIEQ